jgi:hypothetical protein
LPCKPDSMMLIINLILKCWNKNTTTKLVILTKEGSHSNRCSGDRGYPSWVDKLIVRFSFEKFSR